MQSLCNLTHEEPVQETYVEVSFMENFLLGRGGIYLCGKD